MLIPSTPESLARLGLDGVEGLVVLNVTPGGAAYRAGVRNGALVAKVNGKSVNSFEEYDAAKAETPAGSQAEVEFILKKESKTVSMPHKE